MAGLDFTAFNYALQTEWPDGLEFVVVEDNPFLAMVPKDQEFGGRNKAIDVVYGDTSGRSATFSRAQANVGAHAGVQFLITSVNDYAYAVIDRKTMLASQHKPDAAAAALATEMDSAQRVARNSLGQAVWGDGSGAVGQVASFTGTTVTLVDANTAVNFEIGKYLDFSGTLSGGSVRAGTPVAITGIDRDQGILTIATGGYTGLANLDYIYANGDYSAKMSGLDAWIPPVAPTNTPFFGVDRTKDVLRLGGLRYNGASLPIDEALIQAAAKVAIQGGKPSHVFMNFLDFANLETTLGTKKTYEDLETEYGIGFKALKVSGPKGDIMILGDRNCPRGRCKMLDMSSWELNSTGKLAQIVEEDGNKILRRSGTDDFEIRIATYAQLACYRPGHNVDITLAT